MNCAIPTRWSILGVLFFARLTMAFQFQSVAALTSPLIDEYQLGIDDIGLLIGIYLAPGLILAIPGGAIAIRLGDKRVVAGGILAMLVGGTLMGFGTGWLWLLAGRALAGIGGVIINVVMTKLLVDWFVEREIATAMAVYVNSWPIGIAFALLLLPKLAASGGLALAWTTVVLLVAIGLTLFLIIYRPPENAPVASTGLDVQKLPIIAIFLTGAVWALYNAALAMVFSFGPALLQQQGWSSASAAWTTSTFMFAFSIFLPFGGILMDKTGHRDTIILISFSTYAIALPLAICAPAAAVPTILIFVGILFSLSAGPIMTLPARILEPAVRGFGMGVFWSIYYVVMFVAPSLGGVLVNWADGAKAAFLFGSGLSIAGVASFLLLLRIAGRQINSLKQRPS